MDDQGSKWSIVRHSVIVFCGVMAGTFMFLFLASIYFGDPIMDSIISAHGILIDTAHPKVSPDQSVILSKMISEGAILPASNVLSTTIAYYQSVIDTLVAILAILGVLAYFYIKSVSARDAEKMANKAVKAHFLSIEFNDLADNSFSRNWAEKTDDAMADIGETLENMGTEKGAIEDKMKLLEDIQTRVLNLEEQAAKNAEIIPDSEGKVS